MRKFVLARVSYRDDFLISYRIYMMTGSFHVSLFEGTLHVDKIHMWFKIANIMHVLPIPVYRQTDFTPILIPLIPLWDFVPEWNSRPSTRTRVNWRRGDSRWHDILWWYHVTNIEPWQGTGVNSLWAKVAPVSCKHPLRSDFVSHIEPFMSQTKFA